MLGSERWEQIGRRWWLDLKRGQERVVDRLVADCE